MCALVPKPFVPFAEEVKTFCKDHIPLLLKRAREIITVTKNMDKNDDTTENDDSADRTGFFLPFFFQGAWLDRLQEWVKKIPTWTKCEFYY